MKRVLICPSVDRVESYIGRRIPDGLKQQERSLHRKPVASVSTSYVFNTLKSHMRCVGKTYARAADCSSVGVRSAMLPLTVPAIPTSGVRRALTLVV